MKDEEVKQLCKDGKTYREVQNVLGYSLSTISKRCSPISDIKRQKLTTKVEKYLRTRIEAFQRRGVKMLSKFTVKDFLDKFGIETRCAITGLSINLEKDRNWSLDHKIPVSKGGDNSLDNCQIVLSVVNRMKLNLDEEEIIEYCKIILTHKGYKIY